MEYVFSFVASLSPEQRQILSAAKPRLTWDGQQIVATVDNQHLGRFLLQTLGNVPTRYPWRIVPERIVPDPRR